MFGRCDPTLKRRIKPDLEERVITTYIKIGLVQIIQITPGVAGVDVTLQIEKIFKRDK